MPPNLTAGAERAHALLAGYLGGLTASHGLPAGRAALEATRIAADELLVPQPTLDGLARRWAALDGATALDRGTSLGLAHLATGLGPRNSGGPGEPVTFPLLLPPVALLTFDSPRNLLSATYHVAGLTHPHEESRWCAVAVNVALARFLSGYRDFVPDLIEALRNNDAPASLLGLARRLPVLSPGEIRTLGASHSPAVCDTITALWLAEREPMAARGLEVLRAPAGPVGRAAPAATVLSATLFGARDARAEPPLADSAPAADIRALALRLARLQHH